MNKICTTIEQSKRLVELGIDVNTADMYHAPDANVIIPEPYITKTENETLIPAYKGAIPCWSLTALLNLIKDKCGYFELVYLKRTYDGMANPLEDVYRLSTDVYDMYNKEAVDICYEMIIKLRGLNLL